jgi:hypothetical protein
VFRLQLKDRNDKFDAYFPSAIFFLLLPDSPPLTTEVFFRVG